MREMRRDGWVADGAGPKQTTLGLRLGSLEGGREGAGLINERWWVVEGVCPHSPLCHQCSQWLHQFAAIITSIGQEARMERRRS